MSELRYVVTGTITGEVAAFRDLGERMAKMVEAEEPDCLEYDWFCTPDGSTFAIREGFKSEEAFLKHLENVGPAIGDLLAIAEMQGVLVLGTPSASTQEAMAPFGPIFMDGVAGLS